MHGSFPRFGGPRGRDVTADPRTERIVVAFEGLSPASLPALLALYSPEASFKDPFNDVIGHRAIAVIFEHMFATVDAPRFEVLQTVTQGEHAFLTWDFHFQRRPSGLPLCVRGATHLRFDTEGRIVMHRDYWDAAEELYAKLPVLGPVMRWLQRRLRATANP